MPLVQVSMRVGRTPEQKRRLVRALTDAMVDTVGVRRDRVTVIIQEVEPDHWANGGVTLAEEPKAPP
jgi:4-oxalocrotonate tautomerase